MEMYVLFIPSKARGHMIVLIFVGPLIGNNYFTMIYAKFNDEYS